MPFKYKFQKALPKIRKAGIGKGYTLKDVQSRETMHILKAAGFVIEGEIDTENNTTFGMVNGDEHIVVTDSGKYPYYLGDTTIRPGYCTIYRVSPINLR